MAYNKKQVADKLVRWDRYIKELHLPRYDELPSLELYMDQVIVLLNQYLRHFVFAASEDKLITPSMVNNYVKQQVLVPSEKKKYRREHLARLITISVLKRVLSVAEIKFVFSQLDRLGDTSTGYDLFCTQLESRLRGGAGEADCDPILASAVDAVAGKLLFEAKCDAVCETGAAGVGETELQGG